jgi:hypothetical protein
MIILALLQGTPFSDYTIHRLALLILVGGSSLFVAATILTGLKWVCRLRFSLG